MLKRFTQLVAVLAIVGWGVSAQADYISTVLAYSPLSYWKLNESNMAAGQTALNSATSGAPYNGTYSGASVTPVLDGIPGAGGAATYVASFSGSGEVTASDANLPAGSNARSMVAWVKTNSLSSSTAYNVVAAYGTTGTPLYRWFAATASGTAGHYNTVEPNNYGNGLTNNMNVNDGTWHMVALTLDPTQTQVIGGDTVYLWALYVDGSSATTYIHASTVLGSVQIGNWPGIGSGSWPGKISQVAYFGATLTSSQISALYTAGTTAIPEPGTLVLLATGLIGLLCYAWRKRK